MSDLKQLHQQAAQKEISDRDAALKLPKPRQRLDAGLAIVLTGLCLAGVTGGFLAAGALDVSGLLDPPVMSEVEDRRILTDYRDNRQQMVDVVATGNDLLIGRQNGAIDVYDTRGRQFTTETLPAALPSGLALLSADCADPECADAAVFALSNEGGLAAREGGDWRLILGEMAFRGTNGQPVTQQDLRGWAVSDDGRHVLVDAGAQGLGLFDQSNGSWQTLPPIADVGHGPLFHSGSFWLGSETGLHRVQPGGPDQGRQVLAGTAGAVLDLSADPARAGVLVLRRSACSDGGQGCLSLLEVTSSGQVTARLQELESHPALNDSGLKHAALQSGTLITIGSAGVHQYQTAGRRWQSIADNPPTAWFATSGGTRLHVALVDRLITFREGQVRASLSLDAPLVQIVHGTGDELFGLDRDGRVLALASTGVKVLAAADPGLPADAKFTTALAIDTLFIALGPQGVLVHDISRRRYSFVPAQSLPPLPLEGAFLVPAGNGRFWTVGKADGSVSLVLVEGDFPDKTITVSALGRAGLPVVQARRVDQALELIGRNGAVYRLTASGSFDTVIGASLPVRLSPVSIAVNGPVYALTDGDEIWTYNSDERGWDGPFGGPGDARMDDLAPVLGGFLALDVAGGLHHTGETDWQAISGAGKALLGLDQLQDAMAAQRQLYLAGQGRVQAYLPDERRFGGSWQVAGSGAELLAVSGGQPLWANSAGVHSGTKTLLGGAGFVDGWLGRSGPVALFQEPGGGQKHLKTEASCVYFGTPAPRGLLRDVVPLDAQRLLVRTESATAIYEPALHRWYPATVPGLSAGSQLLALGGHLVRLDPEGMASVPLAAIPGNPACERNPVRVDWRVETSGVNASLVDGAPEILILASDRGLLRWRDGALQTDAAAPGDGPLTASVLRSYVFDRMIVVLTRSALWTYDTDRRVWRSYAFSGAPDDVVQIDMSPEPGGYGLTLWGRGGAAAAGVTDLSGATIRLSSLRRETFPVIPIPPADIHDFAMTGDRLLVLSDQRLLRYAPGREVPDMDLTLPAPQRNWEMKLARGETLMLIDNGVSGPQAFYFISANASGSTGLTNLAARYLPDDDRDFAFVAEGPSRPDSLQVLYRIDRQQRSWRCQLIGGQAPDCTLLADEPMALSPDDMLAYDENSRVMLTRTDLLQLSDSARLMARIDGPRPTAQGQLLRHDRDLLYWEGPQQALWSIHQGGAQQVLDQVAQLRRDSNGVKVIAAGNSYMLRDGAIVPARLPDAFRGERILRQHQLASGQALLLESGRALALDSQRVSHPDLQFSLDARAVLPLPKPGRGTVSERWLEVAADGQLALKFIGNCALPVVPGTPRQFQNCAKTWMSPVRLGADEVPLGLAAERGALILITDRQQLTISSVSLQQTGVSAAPAEPLPTKVPAVDPPGGFRMVDGTWYLNPPRFDGDQLLGAGKSSSVPRLQPGPVPAADWGWMHWQRGAGNFVFTDAAGGNSLSADALLIGGRFAFMLPGHPLRLTDGTAAWLTEQGLWHQRGRAMVPVRLGPQSPALGIDAGQFLTNAGRLSARDGSADTAPVIRREQSGPLELVSDPIGGSVRASLSVGAAQVNALAARGFLHDQRLAVAQAAGVARYLTPLGLVPVRGLNGVLAAPPGIRRLAAEGGAIVAELPGGWQKPGAPGQAWLAAPVPYQNAVLADENGRRWERRMGVTGVGSIVPSESWRVSGSGLAFDIDQLLGFAATPDVAVAITGAGSIAVGQPEHLAQQPASVAAGQPQLPIDSWRGSDDRFVLFSRDGQVWDLTDQNWRTARPEERVWQSRIAARLEGITLSFTPQPEASITAQPVGGPSGSGSAVPFNWRQGGLMPFDHVTALHAEAGSGDILIGTKLGARLLTLAGAGYRNGPLLLPAAAGGGPLAAEVQQLARPDTAPGQIEIAYSSGACAVLSAPNATPQACASAQLLTRFVEMNDFWHISKSAGAIRWAYLIDGSEEPLGPVFQGHLPHDRLQDRTVCSGHRVEHWAGSEVLRVDSAQYRLAGLKGLWCQEGTARLDGGGDLAAGLYAETGGGALRFTGAGFLSVPSAAAAAAALRAARAGWVVLESGSLRYGIGSDGLPLTSYYAKDKSWQRVNWSRGRLELDQPLALAWRGGLQNVTAAGVIAAPKGLAEPGNLMLMTSDNGFAADNCQPIRAEVLDGRSHGLAATPGGPVRIYCQKGAWLEGVTDGSRDRGTFQRVAAQASDRLLVTEAGYLTATARYSELGEAVSFAFTFRNEPARLTAGRFDFDVLTALASVFRDSIEVLSDSGWWQNHQDMALYASRRAGVSIPPREVVSLTADYSRRNGRRGLCLGQAGGKGLFWDGNGAPEAVNTCREARGQDDLWQWWQIGDQPVATATSLNGITLERAIENGRFSDLILAGAPLRTADQRLLAPSALGVLVLDEISGLSKGIYALDPPGVLTRSADGAVVWLAPDGALRLEAEGQAITADQLVCPGLYDVAVLSPQTAEMLRQQPGGGGWVDVRLRGVDGISQALIDCHDAGQSRPWTSRHSVSDHSRSQSQGAGRIESLQISLEGDELRLSDGHRQAMLPGHVATGNLRGLAVAGLDGNAFVISDGSLFRIDLAAAISHLASHGQPVPVVPVVPVAPAGAGQAGSASGPATRLEDAVPAPPQAAAGTPASPTAAAGPAQPSVPAPATAAPSAQPPSVPAPSASAPVGNRRPAPAAAPAPPQVDLSSAASAAAEANYSVAAVQRALGKVLGRTILVDGIRGPRTRTAIRDWQTLIGEAATGHLSVPQLRKLLEDGK